MCVGCILVYMRKIWFLSFEMFARMCICTKPNMHAYQQARVYKHTWTKKTCTWQVLPQVRVRAVQVKAQQQSNG